MSKEITNQLICMLKDAQEIKIKCKNDNRLRILYNSEFMHIKANIIKHYRNEFGYMSDDNATKCYALKILNELGITNEEL